MLVARVGALTCALPIALVVETMRPLPAALAAIDGAALPFLRGVAAVRGAPLPVIDVARLLGEAPGEQGRFVIVRTDASDARRLALLVDDVVGVRAFEQARLAELAPLVRAASRELVEAIGARDEHLLVVLDAARIVPDAAWRALDAVAT
jgi:purine-binding chemotaxis protein CheW